VSSADADLCAGPGVGRLGVGFSTTGMVGGDAVIYKPTANASERLLEYDITAKVSTFGPYPTQVISKASGSQKDGLTTLVFTRPLSPKGKHVSLGLPVQQPKCGRVGQQREAGWRTCLLIAPYKCNTLLTTSAPIARLSCRPTGHLLERPHNDDMGIWLLQYLGIPLTTG